LSEKVSQGEQESKAATSHLGEVSTSVTSIAQKLAARLNEQDRRLDALSKAVDRVAQDAPLRGGNKGATRQSTTKPAQRSTVAPVSETERAER
jgi:hypothetical protein